MFVAGELTVLSQSKKWVRKVEGKRRKSEKVERKEEQGMDAG